MLANKGHQVFSSFFIKGKAVFDNMEDELQ